MARTFYTWLLALAFCAASHPAFAEAVSTDVSLNTNLPKDLSPFGMYQSADIVVKAVLITLLAASIVTWTIAVAKWAEILLARNSLRKSAATLAGVTSLTKDASVLLSLRGGIALFSEAALEELRKSTLDAPASGIKERFASTCARLELALIRRLNRTTGVLATVGSLAPFVGLFGTVWGIMNSFIGISHSHASSLAIVAPGIAEALLATATGLIAAIPAVMFYNMLTRSLAAYKAELGDAVTQVQNLVSRDLDWSSAGLFSTRNAAE